MVETPADVINNNIKAIYGSFQRGEVLPNVTTSFLSEKTDGTYVQNGLAFKLDAEAFNPQVPLIGLDTYGYLVARSELKYLIKKFLPSQGVAPTPLSGSTLNRILEAFHGVYDGAEKSTSLLMPFTMYSSELRDKLPIKFDSELKDDVLDVGVKIPIIWLTDDIIGNQVLVINKDSIWTRTLVQPNYIDKAKSERLHVGVTRLGTLYRFEIKTVLKLELRDKNKLRLFSLPPLPKD